MPRAERDHITGLGLQTTEAVLSLDAGDGDESSDVLNSATVYVAVDNAGGSAPATGIVAVTLQAEVLGQRQTVATAFVVPGFVGVCINVSGLNVDGWHVVMKSSNSQLVCKAALAAKYCCAGFEVFVPADLLDAPLDQLVGEAALAALFTPAPNPMMRRAGQYFVHSQQDTAGTFTLLPGERITHILVRPSPGGADVTVTITSPRGQSTVVVVDESGQIDMYPEGNLPAASIDFTFTRQIIVETVR